MTQLDNKHQTAPPGPRRGPMIWLAVGATVVIAVVAVLLLTSAGGDPDPVDNQAIANDQPDDQGREDGDSDLQGGAHDPGLPMGSKASLDP